MTTYIVFQDIPDTTLRSGDKVFISGNNNGKILLVRMSDDHIHKMSFVYLYLLRKN